MQSFLLFNQTRIFFPVDLSIYDTFAFYIGERGIKYAHYHVNECLTPLRYALFYVEWPEREDVLVWMEEVYRWICFQIWSSPFPPPNAPRPILMGEGIGGLVAAVYMHIRFHIFHQSIQKPHSLYADGDPQKDPRIQWSCMVLAAPEWIPQEQENRKINWMIRFLHRWYGEKDPEDDLPEACRERRPMHRALSTYQINCVSLYGPGTYLPFSPRFFRMPLRFRYIRRELQQWLCSSSTTFDDFPVLLLSSTHSATALTPNKFNNVDEVIDVSKTMQLCIRWGTNIQINPIEGATHYVFQSREEVTNLSIQKLQTFITHTLVNYNNERNSVYSV